MTLFFFGYMEYQNQRVMFIDGVICWIDGIKNHVESGGSTTFVVPESLFQMISILIIESLSVCAFFHHHFTPLQYCTMIAPDGHCHRWRLTADHSGGTTLMTIVNNRNFWFKTYLMEKAPVLSFLN